MEYGLARDRVIEIFIGQEKVSGLLVPTLIK